MLAEIYSASADVDPLMAAIGLSRVMRDWLILSVRLERRAHGPRHRALHAAGVERRPPAACVISRELEVVALVRHPDSDGTVSRSVPPSSKVTMTESGCPVGAIWIA